LLVTVASSVRRRDPTPVTDNSPRDVNVSVAAKARGGTKHAAPQPGAFFMPPPHLGGPMSRIFDSDGAPLSYQHLGRLAPEPPAEHEFNSPRYAEIDITRFPTAAPTRHELLQDLINAYHLRDADTLDFDME